MIKYFKNKIKDKLKLYNYYRNKVKVEDNVTINLKINEIGKYTFIGKRTIIGPATRKIGAFCSIAPDCHVGPNSHFLDRISTSSMIFTNKKSEDFFNKSKSKTENYREIKNKLNSDKTIIGNDVWIGSFSIILPGVEISDGAVIGAGAVVTKNVDPYSICVGNPAKHIKYRFSNDVIKKIIRAQIYSIDPDRLIQLFSKYSLRSIDNYIDELIIEIDRLKNI